MTTVAAPDRLVGLADSQPGLAYRGRHLDTVFLLEVGATPWLVRIHRGRVEEVVRAPAVMPRWDFALRADEDEWAAYWQDVPPPGHHDLMAMIKRRVLRVEGDLAPFMGNLFYFKALLALLRPAARLGGVAPLPVPTVTAEAQR